MDPIVSQSTAAIILAAGESQRLGRPKQAVAVDGRTLLERIVTTALASAVDTVIVVLGANADMCHSLISSFPVTVVVNDNWRVGLSSSIKAGLKALEEIASANTAKEFDSALFLSCDQPFVTGELLNTIVRRFRAEGHSIVASEYEGQLGIPALFNMSHFPELLQLKGDCGARGLIAGYRESVGVVPFSLGQVDIDTEPDLHLLEALSGQ